jgi:hypothetical protein
MIDVVEKNQKLAISALGHYVERLKKIEADDDITLLITEPLKSDLTNEQLKVQQIIAHVKKQGFVLQSEFATSIFAKHSEMANTLTAALLCYYNDMSESLEIVSKKLTNGPEFALVKQELQFCKEFLNSINAEHGMDIKVS